MDFSSDLARLTVRLAGLAYEQDTTVIDAELAQLGLHDAVHFDMPSTQAFVASGDEAAHVAFRGTQEPEDWLTNAKFLPSTSELGVKVHSGFSEGLNEVWGQIEPVVASAGLPVIVTGHSLGAALASLAAIRLSTTGHGIAGVYTYGQPRTGHSSFASLYNSALGSITFRFINHIDLVTRVPLLVQGYRHVGRRMYFDASELFHKDASIWRVARDDLLYRLTHIGRIESVGIQPHLIDRYKSLVNVL